MDEWVRACCETRINTEQAGVRFSTKWEDDKSGNMLADSKERRRHKSKPQSGL